MTSLVFNYAPLIVTIHDITNVKYHVTVYQGLFARFETA